MWHKIPELYDLQISLPRFSEQLLQLLRQLDLEGCEYEADHIAVRCNEIKTAERWLKGFSQCSTILSDSEINGRPIYIFKLEQPIALLHWQIPCVELPFPTEKKYPQESWEHIELVIPCQPTHLVGMVEQLLPNLIGLQKKQSQPKGRAEELPNPTVAVSNGLLTIKFHPYSIDKVVASKSLEGDF